MIPDELRRAIIHELDGMVSEFIHPNEFGGYDVDYGQLADAVMPLIEAQGVEIAELRADRDMHLRARLDVEKILDKALGTEVEDGAGAGLVGDVALLADRLNLALWLHAEVRQACDYVNAGYDALQTAYADAGQQLEAVEAERDRLSTLLRGMARRASHSRRLFRRRASRCNIFMHERNLARAELARLRAELARLRERAVALPEDWKRQMLAIAELNSITGDEAIRIVESWRPSTGDTDWTAKFDALFPPDAANEAFRVQLEDDEYAAERMGTQLPVWAPGGRLTIRWQDGRQTEHRIVQSEPAGDGVTENLTLGPAALPEGHAEPESAWGKDRPVHGHTEQTGDQA